MRDNPEEAAPSRSSEAEGEPPETPVPPEHRRRPRYSGKHPRRFQDKYKELQPERYPETVAKVLASGKTPAGMHVPIMVGEILEILDPKPGQLGIDATLGHGGHARALLDRLRPEGRLIGFDADPLELPRTESRLRVAGYGERELTVVNRNHAGLSAYLDRQDPPRRADFILADLGCSSMQFDEPERGFSHKREGPLDMRWNPGRGLTAAAWLEKASASKAEAAFRENSDEPRAALLAEALAGKRLPSTLALVAAVKAALPSGLDGDEHERTLRRVFQAIRIEVNDEFSSLDAFLRQLPGCLAPGGRVAVLTFHSGEDRRVKQAFLRGNREGIYARIARDPLLAGLAERRNNPRSAPAKLRWAEKTAG